MQVFFILYIQLHIIKLSMMKFQLDLPISVIFFFNYLGPFSELRESEVQFYAKL